MRKILLLSYLFSFGAMACPYCSGDTPKDQSNLIVIGFFIAFTYVPMVLFYRVIKKYSAPK